MKDTLIVAAMLGHVAYVAWQLHRWRSREGWLGPTELAIEARVSRRILWLPYGVLASTLTMATLVLLGQVPRFPGAGLGAWGVYRGRMPGDSVASHPVQSYRVPRLGARTRREPDSLGSSSSTRSQPNRLSAYRAAGPSRLRHKYQEATLANGRHGAASRSISVGLGRSSSAYAFFMAARIP